MRDLEAILAVTLIIFVIILIPVQLYINYKKGKKNEQD